jgi:hypothetical protein
LASLTNLITKTVIIRPNDKPFMNSSIRKAIRKRNRIHYRAKSTNSGRLVTLLDLSPADFRRFLTVLVDRRLLGSQCCTGLVAKSGVLTNLFILSKHGPKANIRSTKMANNRHAYNRDVLQSHWTSDELPLYRKKPTGGVDV